MKIIITQVSPAMGQEINPFDPIIVTPIPLAHVSRWGNPAHSKWDREHPPLPIHTQAGSLEGCKVGDEIEVELIKQYRPCFGKFDWSNGRNDYNGDIETREVYLVTTEAKETVEGNFKNEKWFKAAIKDESELMAAIGPAWVNSNDSYVTHEIPFKHGFVKGWEAKAAATKDRDEWISVGIKEPDFGRIMIWAIQLNSAQVITYDDKIMLKYFKHWQPLPNKPIN
jgi:hypothetical protein